MKFKKLTESFDIGNKMTISIGSGFNADGCVIKVTDDAGNILHQEQYSYGYNASYNRKHADWAEKDYQNAVKNGWKGYSRKPFIGDIVDELCTEYKIDKNSIEYVRGKNVFSGKDANDKQISNFRSLLNESIDESTSQDDLDEGVSSAITSAAKSIVPKLKLIGKHLPDVIIGLDVVKDFYDSLPQDNAIKQYLEDKGAKDVEDVYDVVVGLYKVIHSVMSTKDEEKAIVEESYTDMLKPCLLSTITYMKKSGKEFPSSLIDGSWDNMLEASTMFEYENAETAECLLDPRYGLFDESNPEEARLKSNLTKALNSYFNYSMNEDAKKEPVVVESDSSRYIIVGVTVDGVRMFWNSDKHEFVDDVVDATIYDDQDAAREEWFNVPRGGFRRIFVPIYEGTRLDEGVGSTVIREFVELLGKIVKSDPKQLVNTTRKVVDAVEDKDLDRVFRFAVKQAGDVPLPTEVVTEIKELLGGEIDISDCDNLKKLLDLIDSRKLIKENPKAVKSILMIVLTAISVIEPTPVGEIIMLIIDFIPAKIISEIIQTTMLLNPVTATVSAINHQVNN